MFARLENDNNEQSSPRHAHCPMPAPAIRFNRQRYASTTRATTAKAVRYYDASDLVAMVVGGRVEPRRFGVRILCSRAPRHAKRKKQSQKNGNDAGK
jgi:hypothetical protein